jgi:Rne/Rng family ribonuclease
MSKEMVISSNPHETRVAIMEEGQLCEYYVERQKEFALVGSIYKGRVTRVLPGMQSAFVEIGLDSDAFLYVSDFLEESEELDHIVTTVVEKVEKMEEQGGHVFAAENPAAPALEPADVESSPAVPAFESAAETPAVPHESASHGPSSHVVEPMEGESITRGEGFPQSAPLSQSYNSAPHRPNYGDRGRKDRDFKGRGGRGGGRGGRGGRFNRGGRGGDRPRFGRDLPASKYASPHAPHEPRARDEQSSDFTPAEGYPPIILPGESLAKYRDKPLTPPAASAGVVEEARTVAPNEFADPAAVPQEPPHAPVFESHSDYRSSSHAVEPLPGETLSKWKHPEPPAETAAEPQASSASPVGERPQQGASENTLHFYENAMNEHVAHPQTEAHEEHTEQEEHEEFTQREEQAELADREEEDQQARFLRAAEEADQGIAADELSEDEAATIAEHVAEAQIEEEAREAQRREFASADEAAEAAEASLSELPAAGERESLAEEVQEAVADALDETEEALESEEASREEGATEEGTAEEGAVEETHAGSGALAASAAEQGHIAPMEGEQLSVPSEGSGEPPQQFNARVRNDFRARMQHPRRGGHDRGRRDDRGRRPQHGGGHRPGQGHSRPQARRPQLIADLLKQGQEIIVQIAKEPLGKKGARITSHVALPGRYLVYMPTLDHTGVSRKIASAEDRARLRHLVNDAKGTAGGGFIVRTAAATAPPEDVRADVEFLTRTWGEIKSRSEQRKAPSLLHRDLNLVERILRDYITADYGAIWVDSEEEFTKVVDFMSRFQPALVNRVKLYGKETPIFEEFGIQQEIDKGLRPKVWLKSGGYIVINHTEALVAIDVNTGKFVGKGSTRLEDTIVRTNLEAVKEIVRQMRLRDLGGIIIIDFIDMEERRNREKVMAALEDALRADRAPSKMLRFNEFGLIAITRKRTKQALERTLCQPCPYCTGSGMVKSIPTLCYEIQTEARKMAPEISSGSVTLRVHPEISKALKTREASLIEELEHWTKKSIIIQADPTLHWEQYDIY